MIFDRLCIGTANWAKEYNGVLVSKDEQEKILDYCQCTGIDMLDTAYAYGTQDVGNSYFKKVIKCTTEDEIKDAVTKQPYCIMAHGMPEYGYKQFLQYIYQRHDGVEIGNLDVNHGVSLYPEDLFEIEEIIGAGAILQIPYSYVDRRVEDRLEGLKKKIGEIHVRSVFAKGRALDDPKWSIAFCLMNPYVDRVVIGIDSLDQLKRNMDMFHKFDMMRKEGIEY